MWDRTGNLTVDVSPGEFIPAIRPERETKENKGGVGVGALF